MRIFRVHLNKYFYGLKRDDLGKAITSLEVELLGKVIKHLKY